MFPRFRVNGKFQCLGHGLGMTHDFFAIRLVAARGNERPDLVQATRLLASFGKEIRDFVRHLGKWHEVQRHAALAFLKDAASPLVEQSDPPRALVCVRGLLVWILRQVAGGRDLLSDRDGPIDAQADQHPETMAREFVRVARGQITRRFPINHVDQHAADSPE